MAGPRRSDVEALRADGPVEVRLKEAKSVLNRRKHVDAWFWDRYSVNAYEGCAQACEYCDATSHRYHKHAEFHRVVYAKRNVAVVLARQLARKRPDIVALSGVTEPYQPAERQHRLTRQCLEVLLEHGFGVHIVTKSHLVTDDLPLLRRLHDNTALRVSMTVPTVDPDVSRAIEPRSPSPARRLAAVQELADAGIVVGVTAMPLVPLLADRPEHVRAVVEAAKAHGAHYVLGSSMSMHDRVRDRWMAFVEDRFAEQLPRYRAAGRSGPGTRGLGRIVAGMCRELEIADRIPRPILVGEPLPHNRRVAEALLVRAYRMGLRGESKARTAALRRAGWTIDELDRDIVDIAEAGALQAIDGVGPSIASLIERALATPS